MKNDILKKISIVLCIIISTGAIFLGAVSVVNYFAKTEDIVELKKEDKSLGEEVRKNDRLLHERMSISFEEDKINYEQQQIQQISNYRFFEQREEPKELTLIEKEALEKSQEKLKELKKKREEMIERYEEMKREKK